MLGVFAVRRVLFSFLLVLLVVLVCAGAFRAGVRHAVRVAVPAVAGDGSILIDFDGAVHVYN